MHEKHKAFYPSLLPRQRQLQPASLKHYVVTRDRRCSSNCYERTHLSPDPDVMHSAALLFGSCRPLPCSAQACAIATRLGEGHPSGHSSGETMFSTHADKMQAAHQTELYKTPKNPRNHVHINLGRLEQLWFLVA